MPEFKFCPYCGADTVQHERFCYECGRDLTSISPTHAPAAPEAPPDCDETSSRPNDSMPTTGFCPYCGASIAAHRRFCGKCGTDLTGVAPTRARAPPAMQSPVDDRSERFDESFLSLGHVVLTPFQKTIVNGMECFKGTTRHPDGHTWEIKIYLANSYANAQRFKEQLSSSYQAQGYVTDKTGRDEWMGVLEGTLILVTAHNTSPVGMPATMVVSTPL